MINDIANPTYKPFQEISNQVNGFEHHLDSSSYQSNSRSIKSEDDSPLRKRMFQSPQKKKARNTSQKEIEKVIGESKMVDLHIQSQLEYIQQVRRQAKEILSESEGVMNHFNSAQKSYREHLDKKMVDRWGDSIKKNSSRNLQLTQSIQHSQSAQKSFVQKVFEAENESLQVR